MQELIEVDAGDRRVGLLVVRPVGTGPFPVVIMFCHGRGLSPEIQLSAQRVSASGFAVAMIDRYSRMGRLLSYDRAELLAEPREAKQFMLLLEVVSDGDVSDDLEAVARHLTSEPWAKPAPWGVLGFGVGVRSMIRSMAAHPELLAAGVGFYPTFCVTDEPDSPHLSLSRTSGRIYLAFAGADSVVAMDDNRILAAGLDQLGQRASHETFARVNHGFAVPGATFDRDAADRSFQAALKLFTQALAW